MTLAQWPRRVSALAQVRVEDPARPALAAADDHHLRRVLRASDGDEIVVTNGAGSWAIAAWRDGFVEPITDVVVDEPPAPCALYLTPLNGPRAEWALAKATEVGVTTIVPLLSRRMNAPFRGEAAARTLTRWRRVVREATSQARRSFEPLVDEPRRPDQVPDDVAVCDLEGSGDWGGVVAVAVGPEGGWAPGEWPESRRRVSLGPSVLRAETAAVVAAALVALSAGRWGFTLGGDMSKDGGS